MQSLLPRIIDAFFPDFKTYSYQNSITRDSKEKAINIQKTFPPQKISLFKENGERNDVLIDVDPASHYPYRNDLIKSLNFYPLSGISNQKTSICNELGYWPIIKNDKFGNNNIIEISEAEVIFFGDSFGEARCVNQSDSIQATMTKMGIPTYSFSSGGTSLLSSAASFFEHIELSKKSKKVIYLYYLNDTGNRHGLIGEVNNPYLSKYLKRGYRQNDYIKNYLSITNQNKLKNYSELLISKHAKNSWVVPNVNSIKMTTKQKILNRLKLNWYKDKIYKIGLFDFYIYRNENKYLENLLYRMKVKSESLGKEFFISSIPVCEDKSGQIPKMKKQNDNKKKVHQGLSKSMIDIALKLEIKTIDLSNAFEDCDEYNNRRPNIMNTPSGIHFDEKGYQLLGKELFKSIITID